MFLGELAFYIERRLTKILLNSEDRKTFAEIFFILKSEKKEEKEEEVKKQILNKLGLHAKHYKKMLKFHIAELKNLRMDAGAHPEGIEKKIFDGTIRKYAVNQNVLGRVCELLVLEEKLREFLP